MELKICHLYPDALNLYGDGGNIICMKHRLAWRGIDVTVDGCCIGDALHAADYDLFFIGAGQSAEQDALLEDLRKNKAAEIKAAVEDGKTMLAICGGLELLGNYCENADGTKTVIYTGTDRGAYLPLGDIQRSAIRVLTGIMNSAQMKTKAQNDIEFAKYQYDEQFQAIVK